MSRVVVIGATGHVGTYLVPRLVRAGHEVVALSRGEREPYTPAPDIIHEAAVHAPILPDPTYAAYLRRGGGAGARAFTLPEDSAVDRAAKVQTNR